MIRYGKPVARVRWPVPVFARLSGGLAVALVLALLCGLSAPGFAAAPAGGAAIGTAPAPAPATPSGTPTAVAAGEPAIQQLEAMVSTLENPDARAKLVEQLRTLVAAQKGLAPAKDADAELPLQQTIGATALSFLADRMDVVSRQLVQVANIFADLPGAVSWVNRQIDDPTARDRWVQIGIQLALILAIGSVVGQAVRWLLSRPAPGVGLAPGGLGAAAGSAAAGARAAGTGAHRRLHHRRLRHPVGDRTGAARAAGGAGHRQRHGDRPGSADRRAAAVRPGRRQSSPDRHQRQRRAPRLCLEPPADRRLRLRLFPGGGRLCAGPAAGGLWGAAEAAGRADRRHADCADPPEPRRGRQLDARQPAVGQRRPGRHRPARIRRAGRRSAVGPAALRRHLACAGHPVCDRHLRRLGAERLWRVRVSRPRHRHHRGRRGRRPASGRRAEPRPAARPADEPPAERQPAATARAGLCLPAHRPAGGQDGDLAGGPGHRDERLGKSTRWPGPIPPWAVGSSAA